MLRTVGLTPRIFFSVLFLFFLETLSANAAPPTGTAAMPGATGAAATATGAGANAAGGAPGTPSAFFGQSSLNFSKPHSGWVNWSLLLPPLEGKEKGDIYLCYVIEQTKDPTVPFLLKSVTQFKVSNSIPCYSAPKDKKDRPLLRGDRLRIAIDVSGDAASAFFENVSIMNLTVVLNVVPPIQVALLRVNLGGTSTTTGLGGTSAPEADEYGRYDECIQEIQGYAPAPGTLPCTLPIPQNDIAKREALDNKALILPWPYTLPGDVIPTIYISALYTTPDNGKAWQPNTLYPAGSMVQCPGEDLCVANNDTPNQMGGGLQGISGSKEPKWPGPKIVEDGDNPDDAAPGEGPVLWMPIAATYRTKGTHKDAPDGKPVYDVHDVIVWQSGQSSMQSTIEAWAPTTKYSVNQIIVVPSNPEDGPQQLFAATSSGRSGKKPPASWTSPVIPDNGRQILWTESSGMASPGRPFQEGDIVVWASEQGKVQSRVQTWQQNTSYDINTVILCPPNILNPKLCVAGNTGVSGDLPPASWQGSQVADGNGASKIFWKFDVPATLDRWQPSTTYRRGAAVRCEQQAQRNNFCVASVGGYSGLTEPWWNSQTSSTPGAAATPATPAYQRDNQVMWTSALPSATTASSSSNQVVNLGVQELTQVHAPSLWGLSTAILYTTKRTPNTYAFESPVPAGGCPVAASTMTMTTACPLVSTAYQKTADIALMISPYLFHHWYWKSHPNVADGIDTESKWTATSENFIPEPIFGFGLNSIGNSFYAGLSMEILVRNLQLIAGYGYVKAPYLTMPVSAPSSPAGSVTPNTYTTWKGAPFIGLAFNISGLISGH